MQVLLTEIESLQQTNHIPGDYRQKPEKPKGKCQCQLLARMENGVGTTLHFNMSNGSLTLRGGTRFLEDRLTGKILKDIGV